MWSRMMRDEDFLSVSMEETYTYATALGIANWTTPSALLSIFPILI